MIEKISNLRWYDWLIIVSATILLINSVYALIRRAVMEVKIRNAVIDIWKHDMIDKVSSKNNSLSANAIMYYFYQTYIYDEGILSKVSNEEFKEIISDYIKHSQMLQKMDLDKKVKNQTSDQ